MKNILKSASAAGLLGLVLVAGGCSSSGYPDVDDRCENVEKTIKKNNLPSVPNDARDKRFATDVSQNPKIVATPEPVAPK